MIARRRPRKAARKIGDYATFSRRSCDAKNFVALFAPRSRAVAGATTRRGRQDQPAGELRRTLFHLPLFHALPLEGFGDRLAHIRGLRRAADIRRAGTLDEYGLDRVDNCFRRIGMA